MSSRRNIDVGIAALLIVSILLSGYATMTMFSMSDRMSSLSEQVSDLSSRVDQIAMMTEEAQAEAELVSKAYAEGKLMVYGGLPTDVLSALTEAFAKKYPGIEVEYFRSASPLLVEKARAEYASGVFIPDVISPGMAQCVMAKDLGLLAPYKPVGIDKLYDFLPEDPDHYWHAFYGSAFSIVVHKDYPEDLRPKDWTDFIDPKPDWKDQVVTPDPRAGSSGYFHSYGLYEHYGNDTFNKIWLGLKDSNVAIASSFSSAMQMVISGERNILFCMSTPTWLKNYKDGAPVEYLIMETGVVPYYYVSGCLASKAPHPNAGKLYINWLTSEHAQSIVAGFGYWAGLPGVAADPELPPFGTVAKLQYTVEKGIETTEELRTKWAELMGLEY